ncbi:MAG: GNAT family N-acetyltransferase [Burkholderiales bacterium]
MTRDAAVRRTVVIAPLAATDAEAVIRLAHKVWRAHYPGIITPRQINTMLAQRYRAAAIRRDLARDGVWWDTLTENGRLAAFANYFLTGVRGEMKLDKLYVDTARQRAGLGGWLLDHIGEAARRCGCGRLLLAVNKRNAGAIAAYRKHGFAIESAVVKDIGNGFVMDDYVMVCNV